MGIHSLCLPDGVDVDSVLRDDDYGGYTVESQDNADEVLDTAYEHEERRLADALYYRSLRRTRRRTDRRRLHESPSYGD